MVSDRPTTDCIIDDDDGDDGDDDDEICILTSPKSPYGIIVVLSLVVLSFYSTTVAIVD